MNPAPFFNSNASGRLVAASFSLRKAQAKACDYRELFNFGEQMSGFNNIIANILKGAG